MLCLVPIDIIYMDVAEGPSGCRRFQPESLFPIPRISKSRLQSEIPQAPIPKGSGFKRFLNPRTSMGQLQPKELRGLQLNYAPDNVPEIHFIIKAAHLSPDAL